ncbi:MAG: acyl transferase/acyl hydrolase/lysophospholipase [Piptocephalis tieghemiana]|nr:MAG: acyl transferase/acyl hydrolase/lysophospholipase [Piptocephalis tieghemiana]
MAKDVYESSSAARKVFDEAEDALQMDLRRHIFNGPQEALTMTEVAQPAILTTSIALLRALEAEKGVSLKDLASVALGHSLGEYTALVATGALPLAKAVCLVRLRGLAMTEAVSHFSFPTSMSALMVRKRRLDSLIELIQSLPQADDPAMIAEIANINSSFQLVLSGGAQGVDHISKLVQDKGLAARAVDLPVSAPFHCSLMAPAAERLMPYLKKAPWSNPTLPVISNVTSAPILEAKAIPRLLHQQVTAPVRWYESITYCVKTLGVNEWIAIGPGRVLANLARKERPLTRVKPVGSWSDIQSFRWRGAHSLTAGL